MTDDRERRETPVRLPRALVERLTRPFSRFLRIETAAGAVLLASTLVALILSNSRWADAFLALWETHIGFQIGSREVIGSVKEWINDGLMTLFFFLVALELKRELVLGELGHPRVAALSMAAVVWELDWTHDVVRSTREAVRARVSDMRRWASMRRTRSR